MADRWIVMAIRYDDGYRRVDGEWLFARRRERHWYAADLLSGVFSGGKSSVLYRDRVYERQIAQDVAAWISPYEAVATFMIVATAKPGIAIETLEQAILEHVERAASTVPEPAETPETGD